MPIDSGELPRLSFTAHEIYVLNYAKNKKRMPADPETLEVLRSEKLIREGVEEGLNELTELGELACKILKHQMYELGLEKSRFYDIGTRTA